MAGEPLQGLMRRGRDKRVRIRQFQKKISLLKINNNSPLVGAELLEDILYLFI